jgi:hypothetical protein
MKWIKHKNRRVNLENISYFESVDFKRMVEETGDIRPVFAIRFFFSGSKEEINFEFFTLEERDKFIKELDGDLFNQML